MATVYASMILIDTVQGTRYIKIFSINQPQKKIPYDSIYNSVFDNKKCKKKT